MSNELHDNIQTRRERLLELLGLLGILHHQGVQVLAAAHLELDVVLGLHDLNGCILLTLRERILKITFGSLATSNDQKVLDLLDLLRLEHEYTNKQSTHHFARVLKKTCPRAQVRLHYVARRVS